MAELRKLFTTAQFLVDGRTRGDLRWGEHLRLWRHVIWGVWGEGAEDPTPLDVARAHLLRRSTPAWGIVAGQIYGLDGLDEVPLPAPTRRRADGLGDDLHVIDETLLTSPLQTMVDLATILTLNPWEQANECALRLGLVTIEQELTILEELRRTRRAGAALMGKALDLRPPGAPPTGSMLETLGIQMCRAHPDIPEPVRQFEVVDDGGFRNFLDTAWPDLGAFAEYDGQGHKDQPVYDANRERRVAAKTGWMSTRLVWREVKYNPVLTGRQVAQWLAQARRRSFVIQ